MELSQYRNFLAVLEHGSISRAAVHLGIAQPALSQSIARLEKRLQVKLFERSRRGAVPTLAAQAIAEDVRAGMARLDVATRRAMATRAGLAGPLSIGLVSSALIDVLPRILENARRHAPDLNITLHEMNNEDQARALELGELDIGLMHAPVVVRGQVRQIELRKDRLVAVIPEALSDQLPDPVTLEHITSVGLILYPRQQLPVFYADITDGLRKAGYPVKVNMHANRTMTVLSCVAGGIGIGLLPGWIRSLPFPGVVYRDIADAGVLPDFDLIALCMPRRARAMHLLLQGI